MAHELIYKRAANLPNPVMRAMYRLLALVELFDNEVTGLRFLISESEDFAEVRMLDALEPLFLELACSSYDKVESAEVLETVKLAYEREEQTEFAQMISRFVGDHRAKIRQVFGAYPRAVGIGHLVTQPESLAIFERLEARPMKLREDWDAHLPAEVLDELAAIWGVSA